MKKVVVIDGQGGNLGRLIVEAIVKEQIACSLTVIGTNSVATSAMLKAKAPQGATGENPVVVACKDADIIIGPVGICIADALLGEITPTMARAVGQSPAVKILLPINQCSIMVVGAAKQSMTETAQQAIQLLKEYL